MNFFSSLQRLFAIFMVLVLGFSLLPNTNAQDAPRTNQCQVSWTGAFDQVDTNFNRYLQLNLDSEKSIKITAADATLLFVPSVEAYRCQLETVCSLVEKTAGSTADLAAEEWQEVSLANFATGCGETFSVVAENGTPVSAPATVGNVLDAFAIEDNLNSCRTLSGGDPALRLAPAQNCRTVAAMKVQFMENKFAAALQWKAEREKVATIVRKLNDLGQRIHPLIEPEGSLVETTRRLFSKFNNILAKVGCRIGPAVTT